MSTFGSVPACPYCGHEQEDYWELDHSEDAQNEVECVNCENSFIAVPSIIVNWTSHQAPCLNGSPHEYKPTHTYPKEFMKMRCEFCSDERNPTEQEWERIRK